MGALIKRWARAWIGRLLLAGVALVPGPVPAEPLDDAQVPEPLRPWIGWVLPRPDARGCPLLLGESQRRLCHWPARLALELDAGGGRFRLDSQLYAPGWLALPGDTVHWPQAVADGGRPLAVVERGGRPAVQLGAGRHAVEGRWEWSRLPETLRLPADAGLVDLQVGGAARAHPLRSGDQLWLGRSETGAAQSDHLALKVFRRIDDDLPPRLTTVIVLEVAGRVREAEIGPVLPVGWSALSIGGGLPAQLDADNRLHVQLRPGVWRLEVEARAAAPLSTLERPSPAEPWPAQEVWSFQSRPELRLVDLDGLPAIDPRQTQMPPEWHSLPAFLAAGEAALRFTQTQRGQGTGEPDALSLRRDLWLDFDGGGYTVQDRLGGRLHSRWRLEAGTPLVLGQVLVDGAPQLITRRGEALGVEVRHGRIDLLADSRIDGSGRRLPAHGWNVDVQQLQASLHLPPGWRLLAAPGADSAQTTWFSRWTLLDLFVVLVASVAVLRLFGPAAAAVSLLTLALTWHEPGAPRWSWINLIAALALLQALPDPYRQNRFGRWLSRYRWLSVAAVALIAIPFAVQQARLALYPQLETPGGFHEGKEDVAVTVGAQKSAAVFDRAQRVLAEPPPAAPMLAAPEAGSFAEASRRSRQGYGDTASVSQQSIRQLDPQALTQTGPGLPRWQWRTATLSWSGPVTPEQRLRLWLLPPWLTRLLQLASIALIALTLWQWLRPRGPRAPSAPPAPRRRLREKLAWATPTAAPALLALMVLTPAAGAQDAAVVPPRAPPAALLDELRQRLLAPPDCAPGCAELPRLRVGIEGERLLLRLTVDAAVAAAVPLPVPYLAPGDAARSWQPASVRLDDSAAELRRDEAGRLLAAVPPGRHELLIEGGLEGFGTLSLPLPRKPRRVQGATGAWRIEGVDEQGRPQEALQLLRPAGAVAGGAAERQDESSLPPLWRVTRHLRFGQDWEVLTQVERVGSATLAAATRVPLLANERLTGEDLRSADGAVLVSLAPGQTLAQWSSRLPVSPTLELGAVRREDLFETWRFDVSPLWHVEFSGLPAVQEQENDWWLPTYRPWPGETLSLTVSRPEGAPGQTLTLDAAALTLEPGQRVSDLSLELTLRASQGGTHRFGLPADWRLQSLRIDGLAQPARQENGQVVLNLRPTSQQVSLSLRGDQGVAVLQRTPAIEPGLAGVNATLALNLPQDRWVLLAGGPRLGPAVQFWGVLAVLFAIALALGRVPVTPLRGRHWALLMVGLSQIPVAAAAAVVGWLVALGLRGRYGARAPGRSFNLMQAGLALWTCIALSLLFGAVAAGLLGTPDMQITGNGSSGPALRWYEDRFDTALPQAWALSMPMWVYRVLMLLWALWLANALLDWLRWGWRQYSAGVLWRPRPPKPPAAPDTPTPPMP